MSEPLSPSRKPSGAGAISFALGGIVAASQEFSQLQILSRQQLLKRWRRCERKASGSSC